jgi:hypothetical protein
VQNSSQGSRYRQLREQLPSHAAAIKAIHYLALLVYRLLTRGEAWVDHGAAKYEQQRSAWELANLKSKTAGQRLPAGSPYFRQLSWSPSAVQT